MGLEKHYRKHPECWYRPSCIRCYTRAAAELVKLRISMKKNNK